VLRWACQLHEIGLSISHNGYHKHSAYVLRNADMPGFSRQGQARIAAVVLGHTGKLPKMKDLIENEDDWRLVMCLRLASVLHRSRSVDTVPPVTLSAERRAYILSAPHDWLERNPLTEYDLRQELEEWQRLGKDLRLSVTAS
jgi:exopolyphosphatase / guanosine-5'-triphosphate,3'-diphosphate pyrophosphatase